MNFSIYYPQNEAKQWRRLINNSLFEQLYTYIFAHEPVMLREIKQVISDVKMERMLDTMIDLGIVARKDRRYSILMKPQSTWKETKAIQVSIDKFSKESWTLGLFDYLQKHPLTFKEALFVEKNSQLEEKMNAFPITQVMNAPNGLLYFYSFSDIAHIKNTIGNYFENVAHEKPLSSQQEKVYDLLGDASPDYTLKTYGIWLLKFLDKPIIKSKRSDIFLQSLVELEYLKPLENDEYSLQVPFLQTNEQSLNVVSYLESIIKTKDDLLQVMKELDKVIYPKFLMIYE
ncbi:MAG: DUF1803 domain-containing protein [Streptococcaceae bacterium]|jgi:hypothetical protein|nr:DUF1803 domain-containing protein [Streptococcaceae bacterium]